MAYNWQQDQQNSAGHQPLAYQGSDDAYQTNAPASMSDRNYDQNDQSQGVGFLWGLLSFLVPTAGLVLAIVWWQPRHRNARACLIGWILRIVIGIILVILFYAWVAHLASVFAGSPGPAVSAY